MGVPIAEMSDLLKTTLENLPKDQVEVMFDSQNYEFCQIYQKHRRVLDGGTSITRNVILDEKGNARYRRPYSTETPNVDNIQSTISVPWVFLKTDYSWEVFEILNNRRSSQGFIDMVENRKLERMWGLAELIEERGWLTPTNASDTLYPYGIPYYLNFLDDGETTAGFHGKTIRYQDDTTGTICAGLDASPNPKWRNYAGTYTTIDNALLKEIRQAFRLTKFKPASFIPNTGQQTGRGAPIKMYASNTVVTELEDLLDQRDDNNKPVDLMGQVKVEDGVVMINRVPLQYIPQLDDLTVTGGNDTSNSPEPIYCVDWSKLQPVVHRDYWLVESDPMADRAQPTTLTVYLDGCHNNLCINRRTAGFVIHKPIVA